MVLVIIFSKDKKQSTLVVATNKFYVPREIYLKTEAFWWSILFILLILRPLNEFLMFNFFQEKPILPNIRQRIFMIKVSK